MAASREERYYDQIADRYDWFLSSWSQIAEVQMAFLLPLFREHKIRSVLDCACGTGLQALELARAGLAVTASDLSAGMIEEAQRHAEEAGVILPLYKADIREIRERVTGLFDAVICMGNVLPHLPSNAECRAALDNMHACLRENGLLVLELRYYDELLRDKTRFLPWRIAAREDDKVVTIVYVVDHLEDRLRFHILFLVREDTGRQWMDVETVDYYPITTETLLNLLRSAGFHDIRLMRKEDRILCTARRA
jgi:SAM-dependent methyltransferase